MTETTMQKSKSHMRLDFLWVGAGFSIVYWILESVRDVLAFGKGPLFERIFFPDPASFWMRMMVVCVSILLSVYAQSLRERIEERKREESRFFRTFGIIRAGVGFGVLYWILESLRDTVLTQNGNFFRQIIMLDPTSFWIRILPVFVLVLFSIYAQSLINEKRRAEEALRESEEKFRGFAETSVNVVFQWTKTGHISYVSPSVKGVYGYRPEELVGKHVSVVTPAEGVPRMLKAMKHVLKGHSVKNFEIPQLDREGHPIMMEVNAVPVLKEGKIIGIQGIMRDITERKLAELARKQAEKAIRNSEMRLRKVIEKNADAIIIVDREGTVLFANPAAEVLFGREKEKLEGTEFGFPLEGKGKTEIEIVGRSEKPVVAEMRVVEIGWERKRAFQASLRDVTDRKLAEKAMEEANEKLRKLDQLKSDFLSTVSHELRTPIAIMREGVSLCLDGIAGEVNENQKDLLTSVLESIDRLARLVTDLLDVSKIEAEKIKLRRSSVDLCQLVETVFYDYIKQATEKGVQLMTDLPEKPIRMYIDKDKVTQVFDNLISNALRFTESGGLITIGVAEENDFVECRVADTGMGIAEENIPKLFSKFEQFGRTEGPGYKGTGLGLAIVKGLVEMHGGKVWVESELSKGTTFWFTLEKVPFPEILIVDDEKMIVDLIKKFLRPEEYRLLEARSGEEALEKVEKGSPSLLILDMSLPEMSGYEVIGRLKQDTRTQSIPLLIISGYQVDEEQLGQINPHTAIPMIKKPIQQERLREEVRTLLMESH